MEGMMPRRGWISVYRVLFAALALFAIVYQFWDQTFNPDFRPANFLSFFTIQSNLFAAVVLLLGAFGRASDGVRGAAVLYLTITFVVYGVLLAGYQKELQTTIPWVDTVLHRVVPLVVMFDWLIVPPREPIPLPRALIWLAYPLLYAVYSLIRGPIVGWYPYPFFNPAQPGGYGVVALYCLGIALVSLAFAWLVAFTGKHVRLVAS
jgi:hypothetical protein